MKELEFYMDISPKWWVNSSKDESVIKKYICDQFEYDYYPRVITVGKKQIDLEESTLSADDIEAALRQELQESEE